MRYIQLILFLFSCCFFSNVWSQMKKKSMRYEPPRWMKYLVQPIRYFAVNAVPAACLLIRLRLFLQKKSGLVSDLKKQSKSFLIFLRKRCHQYRANHS